MDVCENMCVTSENCVKLSFRKFLKIGKCDKHLSVLVRLLNANHVFLAFNGKLAFRIEMFEDSDNEP